MKYRRRTPKILVQYIEKLEIKKVVKSKEEAFFIDMKIDNAIKVAESSFTDATKRTLIKEELGDYLEVQEKELGVKYEDAVKLYLEQSKVSEREEKNRDYFFNELLPNLLRFVFEKNPVTANITSSHLNEIASIMQRLPSRNHLNLKRINTYEIITNAIKGEYKDSKKLHIDTVNKNIKRIRSLALFGFKTGLFTMTTAIATVKNQYSARDQRKALTCEEVEIITNATTNQEIRDFINILRYTGMRVGELSKYKIRVIDGIECFDLREAESLKTMSSFRVIPKHPKIIGVKFTYTLEHLSRQVKYLIDENLEDNDKKTTYSLRHTFASELIVRGVGSDIVSELLGHKHIGMTLSRYAKGFSVEQLYKAITTL